MGGSFEAGWVGFARVGGVGCVSSMCSDMSKYVEDS